MKKKLFVAATGQDLGKTTTCLGLISGLLKRYSNVGFIKPVGQTHVEVNDKRGRADKDVVLIRKHFKLQEAYEDMSPVLLPRGFTKQFLDGEVESEALKTKIKQCFSQVQEDNDITLIEGTGHVGVGSIVGLSNAEVASLLNAPVLLIAQGGIGSAFDELALNYHLCCKHGVRVAGIILNRVQIEKREMIDHYMRKALKQWEVPLLGCVPFLPSLTMPCMADFEYLFQTELICGYKERYRHFEHMRLVVISAENYAQNILPNELIITHASRDDIVMANISQHQYHRHKTGKELQGGIILTGKNPPRPELIDQIKDAKVPVLYAPMSSYEATNKIHKYTAKLREEDRAKVDRAIQIVENNLDFDQIIDCLESKAQLS